MFLIGNLLMGIAQVLSVVLNIFMWVIIIRALISWVNPDPHNQIVQILYKITEPVLYPIRRALPLSGVGIDFSPIIVFLVIIFLQNFLVQTLVDFSRVLQQ